MLFLRQILECVCIFFIIGRCRWQIVLVFTLNQKRFTQSSFREFKMVKENGSYIQLPTQCRYLPTQYLPTYKNKSICLFFARFCQSHGVCFVCSFVGWLLSLFFILPYIWVLFFCEICLTLVCLSVCASYLPTLLLFCFVYSFIYIFWSLSF